MKKHIYRTHREIEKEEEEGKSDNNDTHISNTIDFLGTAVYTSPVLDSDAIDALLE